jgi:hypothetical protein
MHTGVHVHTLAQCATRGREEHPRREEGRGGREAGSGEKERDRRPDEERGERREEKGVLGGRARLAGRPYMPVFLNF